jgi:D-alanyl-D-alanine carboxypeptidase
MSDETGTRQITVESDLDLTAPAPAMAGRLLAMVTEFCTPSVSGAESRAAQIQSAIHG